MVVSPVLLAGQVREDVATYELRYEDGAVERLHPVEGYILHEIPSSHYVRGHRLELVIARAWMVTNWRSRPFLTARSAYIRARRRSTWVMGSRHVHERARRPQRARAATERLDAIPGAGTA